jgi:hypothetical protein
VNRVEQGAITRTDGSMPRPMEAASDIVTIIRPKPCATVIPRLMSRLDLFFKR